MGFILAYKGARSLQKDGDKKCFPLIQDLIQLDHANDNSEVLWFLTEVFEKCVVRNTGRPRDAIGISNQ